MAAIDPVEENSEEQAAMFGALADPTRLKLVKLLCYQHGSHALCVNALAKSLGVTQSAVSQHLRLLRAIGMVKGKRNGYHIHYSINPEAVKHCHELLSAVLSIEEPVQIKSCHKEGGNQNVSSTRD
jgi:DNA-binding transcriptional ArsR family regulator